jgi:hypothetical protein
MATRTIVSLIDDLDGTEASETVPFRLDGAAYEIDLNPDNAAALRKTLADYVAHARRASTAHGWRRGTPQRRRTRRAATPTPAVTPQPQDHDDPYPNGASGLHPEERQHVRDWARRNGYRIGVRGRIPAAVLAAYRAREIGAAHAGR